MKCAVERLDRFFRVVFVITTFGSENTTKPTRRETISGSPTHTRTYAYDVTYYYVRISRYVSRVI